VVASRKLELLEADSLRHTVSLNEPNGPLTGPTRPRESWGVSHTQIFLWCVALIVLELQHLKWILWTYWACGKCGRKHKDCACGSKWFMLL
jgi:hypothetical protein